MNQIIPPSFAFRFAFPVFYASEIPRRGKPLLELGDQHLLYRPGAEFSPRESPVNVFGGWNRGGLGFAVEVHGKQHPPVSNPDRPDETDGFQLWLHTRSARTIHRANRLCHQFCVLPNGGGIDGLQPIVRQLPVPRASEDAPLHPPESFRASTETLADGYRLEFWLPAETLNGFDSDDSPQLGFYWQLRDAELGDVCLTVDAAFPFASDPSLWETLDLISQS
jgi:hypothetical protein